MKSEFKLSSEQIERQGQSPITVFHLQGALDAQNEGKLFSAVQDAHAMGAKDIILNLEGLTIFTSAGIRSFLKIQQLLGNDGKLRIYNAPPNIHTVLKMTGILRTFPTFESLQAALDDLLSNPKDKNTQTSTSHEHSEESTDKGDWVQGLQSAINTNSEKALTANSDFNVSSEQIERQNKLPVTVFHLQGALDAKNEEKLVSAIQNAHTAGAKEIIINLEGLTLFPSAGIRAILKINQILKNDGKLKLCNAPSKVYTALKVTGILRTYPNYESLQAALDA